MYSQQVRFIIGFLMAFEAALVAAAGLMAVYTRSALESFHWAMDPALLAGVLVFMALANNLTMLKLGLYSDRRPPSLRDTAMKILVAVFLSQSLTVIGLFAIQRADEVSRLFLGLYFVYMYMLLWACRAVTDVLLEHRNRTRYNSQQILIVGSGRRADLVCKALRTQRSWGHQVIGFLVPEGHCEVAIYGVPRLGEIWDLERVLTEHNIDEVVFALTRTSTMALQPWLDVCEKAGTSYRIVPGMFDPSASRPMTVETIQSIPMLTRHIYTLNPSGHLYKRIMDYGLGLLGFLVFLALYLPVAAAIRLDSPGPVLFRQRRVGRNGRLFAMYKFRTMRMDADAHKAGLAATDTMQGPMTKIDQDPRVTRVGRWLRCTSIDEFPQFINVLRGEMSLVGTRPPTPDEVRQYALEHYGRLSQSPGITGLWQVSGRSEITNFEDVVALDLAYLRGWRFSRDLTILLRTVWVVLRGRGAK